MVKIIKMKNKYILDKLISVRLLKEKCIENSEIVDGILQKDKLFSSPSYAASFVLGRSINGKELWKTKEGLSLNDLETKEMEE